MITNPSLFKPLNNIDFYNSIKSTLVWLPVELASIKFTDGKCDTKSVANNNYILTDQKKLICKCVFYISK